MKVQLATLAIAMSTLATTIVAQAAEETYVPPSVSTKARSEVTTELVAAKAAGLVHYGEQTYVPATVSVLSRAQVKADLDSWNNAGLSDEWHGNATPDITSAAYRSKQAAYERAIAMEQSHRTVSARLQTFTENGR